MNKSLQPSKVEWRSYLVLMPLIALTLNYLLYGSRAFTDPDVWLFSYPALLCMGLVSWYLHVVSMRWLRLKLPLTKQTGLRLALLAVTHLALVSTTYFLMFHTYHRFHFLGYELNEFNLRIALYSGVALTMVATSLWEADYTFGQWKNSIAEKEKMEQLTIQQEFETLKNQVNPHFLFNCFNTLSSLITEDKQQAEVFLDELSKVYRYLMRNNQDGLSPVEREIKFIESYFRLLKTRHGDAVELNISVDRKYHEYLLPSLTLQLLIENAVKHNVLSRNNPLVIDIFTTTGNRLVVSNNFQPRAVKAPSNEIGLENIRSKYSLLNRSGFQVLKDKKTFSVVLPLMWKQVATGNFSTVDKAII